MQFLNSLVGKFSGKIPLRTLLVASFITQIVAAVGLVGWLSFRNGRHAVNDLGLQLSSKITTNIGQNVKNYLNAAPVLNQVNANAIQSGILNPENFSALEAYFWHQIQIPDSVSFVYFGNERGEFIGANLLEDNTTQVRVKDKFTAGKMNTYALDSQGKRTAPIQSIEYDPRTRPWYKAAKKAGQPTWTPIFPSTTKSLLVTTHATPIYNQKRQLLGVLGNEVSLAQIGDFLHHLEISRSGQAFIIERSGDIVATSTTEPLFVTTTNQGQKRLQATQSNHPLIRAATQDLLKKFGSFNKIGTRQSQQHFTFAIDGKQQLVQATPLQLGRGLDWLIVVVIPEADFMEQINANTRSTILLCLLSLVVATLFGIRTSRWIVRPILSLSSAAKKLESGEWEQTLPVDRSDELGKLAESFNSMARQLKESFATLEAKNKELQEFDQLKDEFLANTSHELRTPLNGIIGIAESLIDGATGTLPGETCDNLAMIVSSGRRLSNLVNDILDFSQLKHKDIELQLQPVGMREIAQVVMTISRPLIGQKALQLINSIPPDLPAAEADENRVQQILHNLVGNAIKFTDRGAVEISAKYVEVGSTANLGNDNDRNSLQHYLAITVADTGIGIPEDKFDRIFESFEQADGSTARQYGGTGLGLTVTKKLVELHGGQILVESTVGVGARFTFTLPVSDSSVSPSREATLKKLAQVTVSKPTQNTKVANGSGEKVAQFAHAPEVLIDSTQHSILTSQQTNQFAILIVDDEAVNRQVLFNHLRLQKYIVTQAASGQDAIAVIQSGFIPDLILLDVMMPRMTGYEVCQKIRETWQVNQLPIMMLTAKNKVSDLVAGLEAGANDYLAKPIEKDELLARIKTHINMKQLQQEKALIRQTFGRYVTNEVVSNLLETESGLSLGGERRKITMLTSDLRGFTSFSEHLSPEEVVKILNFYLENMADVITSYQGTIDEFMGDGILVLFGAPTAREDDAVRAVACAVAMQLAIAPVNEKMKEWGLPPLEMGIGINTGEVVVGNIGSLKRTKYGVVGNQVNLTYRIESYTIGGQILISESTLREVGSIVKIDGEKQVQPKGVKQPVSIYDVGGIGGKYNLMLSKEEEVFLPVPEQILIHYATLDGKHVSNTLFLGSIVRLSLKGAEVRCERIVENCVPNALTNIRLNLISLSKPAEVSSDIYAKVLEKPAEDGSFYIHFTNKPPEIEAMLNALYKKA